jgi:hypothetical protein
VVPHVNRVVFFVQSGIGAILYLKPFKDTAQSFAVEGIADRFMAGLKLASVISAQAAE